MPLRPLADQTLLQVKLRHRIGLIRGLHLLYNLLHRKGVERVYSLGFITIEEGGLLGRLGLAPHKVFRVHFPLLLRRRPALILLQSLDHLVHVLRKRELAAALSELLGGDIIGQLRGATLLADEFLKVLLVLHAELLLRRVI